MPTPPEGTEPTFAHLITTWTVDPPPPPDPADEESKDGSIRVERIGETGDLCWDESAELILHASPPAGIPFNPGDVHVETSYGKIVESPPVTVEKTEQLTFTQSDRAELRFKRVANATWRWLGTDPGTSVLVEQAEVRLGSPVTGTLEVTYSVTAPMWVVKGVGRPPEDQGTVDEDGSLSVPAVVSFAWKDQAASATVTFSDDACKPPPDPDDPDADPDGETGEPGPVNIKVVEACGDGDPIPGSTVVVNGKSYSLADGTMRLENVAPGTRIKYEAYAPNCTPGKGEVTI